MRHRLLFLLLLLVFGLHSRLVAETVVFLGDSITAGYGLSESESFPALLQTALSPSTPTWKVVNAGVSGDTTTGGVRRVAWLLKSKPDVVVVALGANDGLRGVPITQIRSNLRKISELIVANGARPVLVGMLMPPNYGEEYRTQFAAVWPNLAAELNVPLLPFLLDGVAADRSLNQADGIHPTAAGQRIVAERMLDFIAPILQLNTIPRIPKTP